MKEYTSCFIGIPLPKQYQQEFETLLKELSQINPQLETTYPYTPHVTGYYLDKQSQFYLPDIAKSVKSKLNILKSAEMTIGGFGYFIGDVPRVIFLNVSYPDNFREFNIALAEILKKFYDPDNDLPFYPHMTVGRLRTQSAQQLFEQSKSNLKIRLNQVSWTFPIREVVLYGADSTKQPQYQEKLIPLAVR